MINRIATRLRTDNVTPGLVWIYVRKFVHQALSSRPEKHSILAILGCQRSGTSVMSRVFFRDLDVAVFREKSALTGGPEGLRYLPFPELNEYLAKQRAPFIVFKMLVESQRAVDYLDTVDGARVVWLFRNYRDIVNSNLTKFGIRNGIDDLRPIVNAEEGNWRSEACSEETRNTIRQYFSESMNPRDAAALFWYARNRLYFEQELFRDDRVMILEYENFVTDPSATMRQIYELCDRPYPGDSLVAEVKTGSISKGKDIDLSPEVDELCSEMLHRMQLVAQNSGVA